MTHERIAALIQQHFPLAPVPGAPRIRVHKATPASGLWRLADADESFTAPYWAHHWGGGLALAQHVLAYPDIVTDKRVLDLGAGSGVVAIAAALSGARHVLAVDTDPYAIIAIRLNAAANNVTIETRCIDLLDALPPETDLILIGDLFYDAGLAGRVTAYLDRCLLAGISALVGDPWRAHLPRERLQLLAEYPGADFGQPEPSPSAVFAFRPA